MPIGDYLAECIEGNSLRRKCRRQLHRWIGVFDAHTHVRVKPILTSLYALIDTMPSLQILDYGCGSGLLAFEAMGRIRKKENKIYFDYHGVDQNEESIEYAIATLSRLTAKKVIPDNSLHFSKIEGDDFFSEVVQNKFDVVVLADVLEHIEDDTRFLIELNAFVKSGSRLLISVPTHRYLKIFGEKFHREIGHVREGYTSEELTARLVKAGWQAEKNSYNTGLISSFCCMLLYRVLHPFHRLKIMLLLFLYPLFIADLLCSERFAVSMFVQARKL